MKAFRALYSVTLLALASIVAAAPPMPASVAQAGEGVQNLWNLVHQHGLFMNHLPTPLAYIQEDWTNFLRSEGTKIVLDYYAPKQMSTYAAIAHGKNRFLSMVDFRIRTPYSFKPHSDYKPEVAALLVEKFAEKMAAKNSKANWGKDLSLGVTGPSH